MISAFRSASGVEATHLREIRRDRCHPLRRAAVLASRGVAIGRGAPWLTRLSTWGKPAIGLRLSVELLTAAEEILVVIARRAAVVVSRGTVTILVRQAALRASLTRIIINCSINLTGGAHVIRAGSDRCRWTCRSDDGSADQQCEQKGVHACSPFRPSRMLSLYSQVQRSHKEEQYQRNNIVAPNRLHLQEQVPPSSSGPRNAANLVALRPHSGRVRPARPRRRARSAEASGAGSRRRPASR